MFSTTKARVRRKAAEGARETAVALDRRMPLSEGGNLLRKAFPDHWSFLLGEIALYSFVLLILTGIYLTLFFHPGMSETVYNGSYTPLRGVRVSEAYDSTLHISFDIRGGLLIRQIHHWAAVLFLAAIGAHMLRIFFTGAFRRPREMNWVLGIGLFVLGIFEGFCGYSLPDDLLSGTGLRTMEGIVLSIPIIGTYLQMFIFGGEFPGHEIIPRLYVTHILLVPGLILALLTAHLILVFYLKHTQWPEKGRSNRNVVGMPLFPQFAARSIGLSLMTFGVLSFLGAVAQINPIWMYGPYQPDQASTDAQPDWYVGFMEGAMRLMPGVETRGAGHTVVWDVFIPAVVLPGLLFTGLLFYPFFERWVTGDRGEQHLCDRPRNKPTRTGMGVGGIIWYAVLLLAGGQDVIADVLNVSVNTVNWVLRVSFFLAPLIAFWLTKRLCLALQAHDRQLLTEGEESGEIHQTLEGAFVESHEPLATERAYTLMLRDIPPPLPVSDAARRRARLRAALSAWYYRDRVEFPATPRQRAAIASLTASPGEDVPQLEGTTEGDEVSS